ncbi:MAG: TRAP transporter substrate-binding protein [Lachnospiraceae bacterium]|nr:TRAP transporter substrate-binding protein [Lachnospiraceae bacterium]
MKIVKRLAALILCLGMIVALTACGSSSTASSDGTYSWYLGIDSGEDTVTYLFAEKFAELVEEYSDGKMTITIFSNATLGSDDTLIQSVNFQDSANFVVQTTAPQVTYIPELAVFDAACVYSDIEDVRTILDDETFYSSIEELYTNKGWKLLAYADQSFRVLTSNKMVTTLSDLKGLKTRTMSNSNHMAFWKDAGASPTAMSFSEVYTSLSNNTIDAQENPYETIVSSKLYEVQDYIITTNHLPHILSLVTGTELYDALSEDEQAILDQAAAEAKVYAREQADSRAEDRIATIEEYGSTVVEFNQDLFDEMQEAAQDSWETIRSICGDELFEQYTSLLED